MPGHKGKNTLLDWAKYIPAIDSTEVYGNDSLHDPRGIIKESQELAAKAFGATNTIYSVNGTTGSVYIALSTITNPGDKVLIQRECHRSVYNGAILNRLELEYIYTNYNERYHIYTGVNPDDIEYKLKENPDIKAVVITYPNYFGICSDIKKIAEIVHKYDKILLVDEAHGSHFIFSDRLPLSSLRAGADIVVQSIHKTLPSFTQTSMIHVGTDRVDIDKLRTMSSIYQTTSPSYLFMASLELARAYMEGEGRLRLNRNLNAIEELMNTLQHVGEVTVFSGDEQDLTIHDKDITKIPISVKGISGIELSRILRENYGIYMEMADLYYSLALTSTMNELMDFKKLTKAVYEIAKSKPHSNIDNIDFNLPKPKKVLPIYEAFYSKKKTVNLKDSIGKVSSSFVIPYPPGIPLLCPGEVITPELIDYIDFANDYGIEIIGLIGYNKEKIEVVE